MVDKPIAVADDVITLAHTPIVVTISGARPGEPGRNLQADVKVRLGPVMVATNIRWFR